MQTQLRPHFCHHPHILIVIESQSLEQIEGVVMPSSPNAESFSEVDTLWASGLREKAVILAEKLYNDNLESSVMAILYGNFQFFRLKNKTKATDFILERFLKDKRPDLLKTICRYLLLQDRADEILLLATDFFRDPSLAGEAYCNYASALLQTKQGLEVSSGFYSRAAFAKLRARYDQQAASLVVGPSSFDQFQHFYVSQMHKNVIFLESNELKPEFVFLTSGDEIYFRAFFDLYRVSLQKMSPNEDIVVHFHLFNPSVYLLDEIKLALKSKKWGNTRFSYEPTGQKKQSYFYAGRFIAMPEFLEHYCCNIFVTDIDCVFVGKIDNIIEKYKTFDVGIYKINRYNHPWENFRANIMMFSPSIQGIRVAEAMAGFLDSAPENFIDFWYVDQLAIALAYYANESSGRAKFALIDEKKYQDVCFQPTGASGNPEFKANRAREEIARRGFLL